ncbi:MAG: AfsR/SARP family transcriptional regulator, partial [Burkholderiaceae bacterium]
MSLLNPSDGAGRISNAPSPPELRLLGGLSIRSGDSSRPIRYESRFHVRAVLALAGSACAGLGRDEMVDLLWPTSEVAGARNRLYHTVHLARQALAAVSWDDEWIVVRHARVVLDKRVSCDVHRMERACVGDCANLSDGELQDMLALCKSDWMPDLDIGPAGQVLRTKIRNLQAGFLREAVSRSKRQGSSTTQRELLLQLLRLQPTEEWAHRELMGMNLDLGRNHAVLRTYEALSKDLSLQLGLKPHPDTSEIAAVATARLREKPPELINGQLSIALAPHFLVGRHALLDALLEQVTNKPGVWNLCGLAGIGKSMVAIELVRRLPPRLTENVFMFSMSG